LTFIHVFFISLSHCDVTKHQPRVLFHFLASHIHWFATMAASAAAAATAATAAAVLQQRQRQLWQQLGNSGSSSYGGNSSSSYGNSGSGSYGSS
jgi:hypothetical protein